MTIIITGMFRAASAYLAETEITKWMDDKETAFTMVFDDSWESHATIAVPELAERGMAGTFYINPGRIRFTAFRRIWEEAALQYGHEVQNHTMEHDGAVDYADAEWEIGECARTIWDIRGPGKTRLQGFARGGGTTWGVSSTQLSQIQAEYHCINRSGGTDYAADYEGGTTAQIMFGYLQQALSTGELRGILFHDIKDNYLYLTVPVDMFIEFLDLCAPYRDRVWFAGWMAQYQYTRERTSATVSVTEAADQGIRINLTSSMDTVFYKQHLTLKTEVPATWDLCRIRQGNRDTVCEVNDATVQYYATPGFGEIRLQEQPSPCVTDDPDDITVYRKERAVFRVSVKSTGPVTYAWQKNGTAISGSSTNELLLASAALADDGARYRCIVSGADGSDTSAAAELSVTDWTPLSGLCWEGEAGVVDSPFAVYSTYVKHDPVFSVEGLDGAGKALYFCSVTEPGDYCIRMKVHAGRDNTNTIAVNIDDEPGLPGMICDFDLTSGFEMRTVSWRGSGTDGGNELAPKTFSLAAGDHFIDVRGLEQKVKIDTIMLVPATTGPVRHYRDDAAPFGEYCRYVPGDRSFHYGISPHAGKDAPVTLKVYDAKGALAATLVNGILPSGDHSVSWHNEEYGSVFMFQLVRGDDVVVTGKLVVTR